MSVRVGLPAHLRTLARIPGSSLELDVDGDPTMQSVLDALEREYPMLAGTIRDRATKRRRPFIRFYACGRDLSLDDPDDPLPREVATGSEPLQIIGAIAGG